MEPFANQQVHAIAARLAAAGVESALWDAKQLLAHVSGDNTELVEADLARLDALVTQRAARVPLQLLLGDTGFRYITVACVPGVFIPRPETEVLVELALGEAATLPHPLVIEPCTGTGAITASLLAELDAVTVYATDLNEAAVRVARHNIQHVIEGQAGVTKRPETVSGNVLHGSLYDPIDRALRGQIDVIVCNPPYLPDAVYDGLPPEVHDYDPYDALVGGVDGHEVVGEVFAAAAHWLKPGGFVAVEVDATRPDDACAKAHAAGLSHVQTHPDLTGARRFVSARRPT